MLCKICGEMNEDNARFCYCCGESLVKIHAGNRQAGTKPRTASPTHVRQRETKMFRLLSRVILAAGVLLLTGVMVWFLKDESETGNGQTPLSASDAAIGKRVVDIASNFVCSCGNCAEESLDRCTCEHAARARQDIRDHVREGRNDSEIVRLIGATYGGLKTDLLKGTGAGRNRTSATLPGTKERSVIRTATDSFSIGGTHAVPGDLDRIIAEFRCPCGQCGWDELKDCDCGHPRGAKEVKAFIQQRIAEGNRTAEEIVKEVERVYGGLKL